MTSRRGRLLLGAMLGLPAIFGVFTVWVMQPLTIDFNLINAYGKILATGNFAHLLYGMMWLGSSIFVYRLSAWMNASDFASRHAVWAAVKANLRVFGWTAGGLLLPAVTLNLTVARLVPENSRILGQELWWFYVLGLAALMTSCLMTLSEIVRNLIVEEIAWRRLPATVVRDKVDNG